MKRYVMTSFIHALLIMSATTCFGDNIVYAKEVDNSSQNIDMDPGGNQTGKIIVSAKVERLLIVKKLKLYDALTLKKQDLKWCNYGNARTPLMENIVFAYRDNNSNVICSRMTKHFSPQDGSLFFEVKITLVKDKQIYIYIPAQMKFVQEFKNCINAGSTIMKDNSK